MAKCGTCGTDLRPTARFCDACGAATAVPTPAGPPSGHPVVEYSTVTVPLRHLNIIGDQRKKPPHPESDTAAEARLNAEIYRALAEAFAAGWMFDGPQTAAQSYDTEEHTSWFWGGNRLLYTQATIRLRRVR